MNDTSSLPLNPKNINKFLLEVATWKTPHSYTVKQGDNLWNIVINFFPGDSLSTKGYKTETIAKIIGLIVLKNKIKDPSLIHPGQKIKLPTSDEISQTTMSALSKRINNLLKDPEVLAALIEVLENSPKPKNSTQKARESMEEGLILLNQIQAPGSRKIKLP